MFRRLFVIPLSGALIGALSVVAVSAQEPAPTTLLTAATVEGFIASYPDVKARAEALKHEYDVGDDTSEAEVWRAWAGIGGAKGQLDTLVIEYGFGDFHAWVRTFSVVGRAYAFAQDGGALDNKMADALARVDSNPNIPAAQKEMIKQQLRHSADAVAAMRPTQESIDAVKPYVGQLGVIFDEDG